MELVQYSEILENKYGKKVNIKMINQKKSFFKEDYLHQY